MTKGSALTRYTPEVMAMACRKCGVEPLKRCRPSNGTPTGMRTLPPHAIRVKDAVSSK